MSDFSPSVSEDGDSDHNGKNDEKIPSQQLFDQIARSIREATGHKFLTYECVDPETGSSVADSLVINGEVKCMRPRIGYNSYTRTLGINLMLSSVYDCHQPWLYKEVHQKMVRTGFITAAESELLMIRSGTTFDTFKPPYALSRKAPNQCIIPHGRDLPALVIESGLTEPRWQLRQDMRLWVRGGSGAVQVVLLFKWSKLNHNKVQGDIEVYNLDPTGNENLVQAEVIFPIPNTTAAAQVITITRGQLFGPVIPVGRNPNDTFDLSLNDFRQYAIESLRKDGYVAA